MIELAELSAFSGWVRFADLPDSDVPREPGVYVVVRDADDPPRFLNDSPPGHFKGRNPTVSVDELESLWVPDAQIVYIGKANSGSNGTRGLRKRLDEFRRFGAGQPVGHSGGRRIWQLADSNELLVGWRVTADADAARIETEMIAEFTARYGRLPFANMRS